MLTSLLGEVPLPSTGQANRAPPSGGTRGKSAGRPNSLQNKYLRGRLAGPSSRKTLTVLQGCSRKPTTGEKSGRVGRNKRSAVPSAGAESSRCGKTTWSYMRGSGNSRLWEAFPTAIEVPGNPDRRRRRLPQPALRETNSRTPSVMCRNRDARIPACFCSGPLCYVVAGGAHPATPCRVPEGRVAGWISVRNPAAVPARRKSSELSIGV